MELLFTTLVYIVCFLLVNNKAKGSLTLLKQNVKENVSFHTISFPIHLDFETKYEIEHGIHGRESSAVINWYVSVSYTHLTLPTILRV